MVRSIALLAALACVLIACSSPVPPHRRPRIVLPNPTQCQGGAFNSSGFLVSQLLQN